MSNPNLKRRGFGSMSPERRKELATKGGKAIKPENRAFSRDRSCPARPFGRNMAW